MRKPLETGNVNILVRQYILNIDISNQSLLDLLRVRGEATWIIGKGIFLIYLNSITLLIVHKVIGLIWLVCINRKTVDNHILRLGVVLRILKVSCVVHHQWCSSLHVSLLWRNMNWMKATISLPKGKEIENHFDINMSRWEYENMENWWEYESIENWLQNIILYYMYYQRLHLKWENVS